MQNSPRKGGMSIGIILGIFWGWDMGINDRIRSFLMRKNRLFFSAVLYDVNGEEEIVRIMNRPVWLLCIRAVYVLLFDRLNYATRGRLGCR